MSNHLPVGSEFYQFGKKSNKLIVDKFIMTGTKWAPKSPSLIVDQNYDSKFVLNNNIAEI